MQNNTNILYFDIETKALSYDKLASLEPKFKAPSNYKSEDAIAKAIASKREEWYDQAALSPTTGEISYIGMMSNTNEVLSIGQLDTNLDEKLLIEKFFNSLSPDSFLVGWNISNFDIPFIIQRAWKHGLKLPCIFSQYLKNPYNFTNILDLMKYFSCNTKSYISLDNAAKFLDLGSKNGETGDLFSQKYFSTKELSEQAVMYNTNELYLLKSIHNKICI